MDSILDTIKKMLDLEVENTSFDTAIIVNINSACLSLSQLGVGPDDGFSITGNTETWTDLLGTNKNLNAVQMFIFLKVKFVFDPPATASVQTAYDNQIRELGWRINTEVEKGYISPSKGVVTDDESL